LRASKPDAVLVGFPGHSDVALARVLAAPRRIPVLLDAFVSLYETSVEDRGLSGPRSLQALRYATEDRLACRLAHRVVLDTDTHVRYFEEHVHVPPRKLRRIWVGADDDVMRPVPPPPDDSTLRVFMYGSFIPLHGLEHVVRAAAVLERAGANVLVDIAGSGQTEPDVRRLAGDLDLRSVRFLGRRPYEELRELMGASHVCLGIFGTSPKAARVIPNKVFDALAVARPVITADTPAAREVLTHGEHAWLCAPGDPDALAGAILALRDDAATRRRIASAGHRLFRQQFSVDAISRDVTELILDAIGGAHG
jgi:glycosyltransferase involved in cell wall biosynthesis